MSLQLSNSIFDRIPHKCSKNTYYSIFFLVLVCVYLVFTWAPQYINKKNQFEPANFSMPLSGLGMDLMAATVGSTMMGQGKSAHLVDPQDPKALHPYPIGNTLQSYGSIAIVGLYPFTALPFNTFRILFFFLSTSIIFFLSSFIAKNWLDKTETKAAFLLSILICSTLLILSGPINLLLERGQLEIFIPAILLFVLNGYIDEKKPVITGSLLGLAIHIKLWPAVLLALFINKKGAPVLLAAFAIWLVPYFLLNPWLPISELVTSTSQYSNAASEMVGWANISLHSALAGLPIEIPWKLSSATWLSVYGVTILFISNFTKITYYCDNRNILFSASIFAAFLAPGFICDYVLVSTLILMPRLSSLSLNYVYAVILALLMSNFLFFGALAGIIKTILMLLFILVSAFNITYLHNFRKNII